MIRKLPAAEKLTMPGWRQFLPDDTSRGRATRIGVFSDGWMELLGYTRSCPSCMREGWEARLDAWGEIVRVRRGTTAQDIVATEGDEYVVGGSWGLSLVPADGVSFIWNWSPPTGEVGYVDAAMGMIVSVGWRSAPSGSPEERPIVVRAHRP